MCFTKISTRGIFKLLSIIYFPNMCIEVMSFLDVKVGTLLCFLKGFGIAVSYKKHPTLSYIVIDCTRFWPTEWYKIIYSWPILNVLHTFHKVKSYIFH